MLVVKNSRKLKRLFNKKQKGVVPLKENFDKLVDAFQPRLWNDDMNHLFKKMCEDLFLSYGINVIVHPKPRANGDGVFIIEFLDAPYEKKRNTIRKIKKFFSTLFG